MTTSMPAWGDALTHANVATIVYWAVTGATGAGGRTFATPVELSVRWVDKAELFTDLSGKERRSAAVLHVDRAMAVGDYVFRGTLNDLDSGEEAAPMTVATARKVEMYREVPSADGTEVVRKVYL